MQLKEIGSYFGIGDSAISESSRQFDVILKKNRKLRKEIEFIRDQVNF